MATYNDEQKTPATGIVGTVLGGTALAAMSGILGGNGLNLFGGSGNASYQNEICNLRMQNAILTSEANASAKLNQGLTEVYTELRRQDKLQDQNLANLNSRVLALETAGPLKEQLFDSKIGAVYDKITCCCNSATASIAATNTALASLQNTVNSFSKIVIPITAVCPTPMEAKNAWVAPTNSTTNAG